jgi:hypothetical protein
LGLLACGSDDPPADNGAVTGADDVDLPEPVDCEAQAVADRLRWTASASVEPGAGLSAVAVHGAHGFSCSDDGGFRAWSLQAQTPVAVEMDDEGCNGVATDGTWVAVARGSEVQLRTVGEPDVVARWTAPAPVRGLTIAGSSLLVAAGEGGWAELALEGELEALRSVADADSDARALTMVGGVVYVADARAGLRAYEGTSLRGTLALDPALDVVASGGALAVTTLEGVAWVDIDTPTAPSLRSSVVTPGSAMAVAAVDTRLVVADFTDIAVVSSADTLLDVEPLVGDDLLDRTRAVAVDPVTGRVVLAQWDSLHLFDSACDGAAPSLWPDRRTLDFRVVSPGAARSLVVALRNEGDAPLSVTEVRTAMPGVSTDFEPLVLEPKTAAAFEVSFTAPDGDPYEGALEIVSNDPDQPVFVLPMSANIRGVRVGEPMVPFRNVDTLGRVWQSGDAADKVLLLAYFADW